MSADDRIPESDLDEYINNIINLLVNDTTSIDINRLIDNLDGVMLEGLSSTELKNKIQDILDKKNISSYNIFDNTIIPPAVIQRSPVDIDYTEVELDSVNEESSVDFLDNIRKDLLKENVIISSVYLSETTTTSTTPSYTSTVDSDLYVSSIAISEVLHNDDPDLLIFSNYLKDVLLEDNIISTSIDIDRVIQNIVIEEYQKTHSHSVPKSIEPIIESIKTNIDTYVDALVDSDILKNLYLPENTFDWEAYRGRLRKHLEELYDSDGEISHSSTGTTTTSTSTTSTTSTTTTTTTTKLYIPPAESPVQQVFAGEEGETQSIAIGSTEAEAQPILIGNTAGNLVWDVGSESEFIFTYIGERYNYTTPTGDVIQVVFNGYGSLLYTVNYSNTFIRYEEPKELVRDFCADDIYSMHTVQDWNLVEGYFDPINLKDQIVQNVASVPLTIEQSLSSLEADTVYQITLTGKACVEFPGASSVNWDHISGVSGMETNKLITGIVKNVTFTSAPTSVQLTIIDSEYTSNARPAVVGISIKSTSISGTNIVSNPYFINTEEEIFTYDEFIVADIPATNLSWLDGYSEAFVYRVQPKPPFDAAAVIVAPTTTTTTSTTSTTSTTTTSTTTTSTTTTSTSTTVPPPEDGGTGPGG